MGIDKTKTLMMALTHLACELIDLFRRGINLDSIQKIVHIFVDAQRACAAAKGVSEELKDLDKQESAELGMLALSCFQQILQALIK